MPAVVEIVARRGGTATFAQLRPLVPASAIRGALIRGEVLRVAKGVYALPQAPPALAAARSQGGVVSHLSAAQHWGFDVIELPRLPHVTVPPDRARRGAGLPCILHWSNAPALDDVTTPIRTVLDCARILPLRDALAIADSALRRGVDHDELLEAAERLRGPHRRRILRTVMLADHRAESVLESALRALLIEAGIEGFVPQVVVQDHEFSARLDLADARHQLGLEADGYEHHGNRQAFTRDCRRHVNLAIRGWRILRFSWEDVMYDGEWVVEVVGRVCGLPSPTNSLLRAA